MNFCDCRLTSIYLRYPMKVHWDLLTHRAFSRNASSGRSISVTRMARWLDKDYVKPLVWVADAKQMKSGGGLDAERIGQAEAEWANAYQNARASALELESIGVHRQDANSLLMAFGWINVLVTATSWDNFLTLRVDDAARPEMQKVGWMVGRALQASKPKFMKPGDWHLPFITNQEKEIYNQQTLLKMSVARCGHLTDEADTAKNFTLEQEFARYDRFIKECAWSTFEHQAEAMDRPERSGNFVGWKQNRQSLLTSVHKKFDFSRLDHFEPNGYLV